MPIKERVVSTAKAEAAGVTSLTKQAVGSGAYLYPLRGIYHIATHRNLWGALTSRLIPLITLSAGVIGSMFVFTYIPQSFLLTFVNGPLAFISTIALVLSESAAIITALSRTFFIDDALVDIFDAVLLNEGCEPLVANGRELRSGGSGFSKLGKAVKKPFQKLSPNAIISYFLWLPLNFIPIIGTAMFIIVQGRKAGPSYHARYFQLKGFSAGQREKFVEDRRPAYLSFGVASVLLQLIPVIGLFPTTVGAALWAVDLEKEQKGQRQGPVTRSKSSASYAEVVKEGDEIEMNGNLKKAN